jgi:hypothetical protein
VYCEEKLSRRLAARRIEVLLLVCGILFSTNAIALQDASAQSPALFPPPPAGLAGKSDNLNVSDNDKSPPKIDVITTELRHGKNVLVVRVTDESDLMSREVRYVDQGRIKFADLGRDHDNVYHALVNVAPPSSVIVIDVIDAAGNRASVTEEFSVVERGIEPGDFLDRITYWWNSILAFVGLA